MSSSIPIRGEAGPACNQRVWATPAAIAAIKQLRAEIGQVVLRHPGGREGEVEARLAARPTVAGRTDFCIGIVGGALFYVGCKEDAALGYPDFEVLVRTESRPGAHGGPAQSRQLLSRAIGPQGSGS